MNRAAMDAPVHVVGGHVHPFQSCRYLGEELLGHGAAYVQL